MPGGQAQLAATGLGDQYLVKDPQITLFKNVWRRYSAFAMEQVVQTWTGDCDFGRKATVTLSSSGDLVSDCWLQVRLPDLASLNHITTAQRLAGTPVVNSARSTTQDAFTVGAFGCGVTRYVLSARADNTPVTAVSLVQQSGLALSFGANVSSVSLVPLGGANAAVVSASVAGNTATVANAVLAANVTYGVRVDAGPVWTNHLVQVRATAAVEDPTFAVLGADPAVPVYRARVLASVAGASVASAEETVMKAKWCNEIGHALVEAVEWQMGGSRIDRHTPEHWSMMNELTETAEKRGGYSAMVGRYDAYDINYDATSFGGTRVLFVPLRFTFNNSPGSALPLVALQFHQCSLNFEFRRFRDLIKTNVPRLDLRDEPSLDAAVYATYVILSEEERRLFVGQPHEYLIDQVQAQVEVVPAAQSALGTLSRKFTLSFTQPVRELVWAFQAAGTYQSDTVDGNDWFNYDIPGREDEEIFQEGRIQINGHDRFFPRPAEWFRLAQPWTHHTRVPAKRVHAYSFATSPEATNPSGAANFSRFDSAQLCVQFNPNVPAGRLRIHALSYNVLRIAKGFAGVLFTS